MNQRMLSIVIPCYNDHSNVAQILDRLTPELMISDFEVIVVDDASTAAGLEVFEHFATTFGDKLQLLRNTSNIGPGPTRNAGLDAATGEHICFVDSDDMLDESFMFYYRQLARDFDFDVAMFRHHIQDVLGETHTFRMFDESCWDQLSREFPVAKTLPTWRVPFMIQTINYPWNKFYRHDYLLRHSIRFPKLSLHEDVPFHWHAMMKSEKSVFAVDYPPIYIHNRIEKRDRATDKIDHRRIQIISASEMTLDIISGQKHLMMYYPIFLRFFLDIIPWAEKKVTPDSKIQFILKCQGMLRKYYRDEVSAYVQQMDSPLYQRLEKFMNSGELI